MQTTSRFGTQLAHEVGMAVQDIGYFRRRLRQEEEAVKRASCGAARERHRELAEAYRLLTRSATACPEPSGPEQVFERGSPV